MAKTAQVTVPLTAGQKDFVKRAAEMEGISEAAVLRRFAVEAARKCLAEPAPVPPPKPAFPDHEPVERPPAGVAEARKRLASIKAYQGPFWRDKAYYLEREIALAEAFMPEKLP